MNNRLWLKCNRGAGLARVAVARRDVVLASLAAVRRHRHCWKLAKSWPRVLVLRARHAVGSIKSFLTARQSWRHCLVCALQRSVGAATFCTCLYGIDACGVSPVVGIAVAYVVAWQMARAQVHSHGASCRVATTVISVASTIIIVGLRYGIYLSAAIALFCPSSWLWWPPSLSVLSFGKLMTDLRLYTADHGGDFPKETIGHPGRQLATNLRNFCRSSVLTWRQLAELRSL